MRDTHLLLGVACRRPLLLLLLRLHSRHLLSGMQLVCSLPHAIHERLLWPSQAHAPCRARGVQAPSLREVVPM